MIILNSWAGILFDFQIEILVIGICFHIIALFNFKNIEKKISEINNHQDSN